MPRAETCAGWLVLAMSSSSCHRARSDPAPFAPPLPVTLSPAGAKRSVLDVVVDCGAPTKAIDPGSYGTGYDPSDYSDVPNPGIYGIGEGYSDMRDPRQWQLGAT